MIQLGSFIRRKWSQTSNWNHQIITNLFV